MSRPVNFDLVARPYRWVEYTTFGPWLERCRCAQLAHLTGSHRALILGDGDGRFLAQLLSTCPNLTADVVDSSPAMLQILSRRIGHNKRSCLHHADALEWNPTGNYDLLISHFFLDCFFPDQLEQLLDRLLPHALPGAQWVISEFAIPRNAIAAYAARVIIALLYRSFGVLTGLRVRTLPDYTTLMLRRGLRLSGERRYLAGLLCSQIWTLPPATLK